MSCIIYPCRPRDARGYWMGEGQIPHSIRHRRTLATAMTDLRHNFDPPQTNEYWG